MISLPVGKLAIMGQIDVLEHDGECVKHPRALLISFEDTDSIRTAIHSGACRFWFGDEDLSPHAIEQQRDELLAALKSAVNVARGAREAWDSDRDVRVGKCLIALSGDLPGYEMRTDEIHAVIARVEASK